MTQIVQTTPALAYSDYFSALGYNGDLDIGTEDIIRAGGSQYWAAAAVAAGSINIASDSADDDTGGTGAITITIYGLSSTWMLQSETVTLNGVANVNPANSYIRIYHAVVATAGSGLTNAGNITIADGSGTFLYIAAGEGESRHAAYSVPANYATSYLTSWVATVSGAATANVNFVLKVRAFGGAFVVKAYANLAQGNTYRCVLDHPIPLSAKSDLVVTGTSNANNIVVQAGFDVSLLRS
jgi:hypothetical protein